MNKKKTTTKKSSSTTAKTTKATTTKKATTNTTKTKTSTKKTTPTLTKKPVVKKTTSTKKPLEKTKISIRYDVGFPNNVYIRGEGAGLDWNKGLLCKNVNSNEWIWETKEKFTTCKFKVLINDDQYEVGEDHVVTEGNLVEYTPQF